MPSIKSMKRLIFVSMVIAYILTEQQVESIHCIIQHLVYATDLYFYLYNKFKNQNIGYTI